MNKCWMPYLGDIINATHFVVSKNNMILNHSCRDMKVGTSYVKSLYKTEPQNTHFYVVTPVTVQNLLF